MKIKKRFCKMLGLLKDVFLIVLRWSKRHKIASILIVLVILILGFFAGKQFFKKDVVSGIEYSLVKRDFFQTSVSGVGPILAVNQVDLKPKVSGDVVSILVKPGDYVEKGQAVVQLAATNLDVNVRDATLDLENAKEQYKKSLQDNSEDKLKIGLSRAYDSAYLTLSSSVVDMENILVFEREMAEKDLLKQNSANIIGGRSGVDSFNKFDESYYLAEKSLNSLSKNARVVLVSNSREDLEKTIEESYVSAKYVLNSLKNFKDYVDLMYQKSDKSPDYLTERAVVQDQLSKSNNILNSIVSAKNGIDDSKKNFRDSAYDLKSLLRKITEKENLLKDAQNKVNDYIVRSPINGLVAKIDVRSGDQVTSSSNIATISSKEKMVKISFSEFDIPRLKVGQKATASFDALPNLTVEGSVAEVDQIGTENQGVVTYGAKIVFNENNEQVRAGMMVSINVVVDERDGVLVVPNSSLKGKRGSKYVEIIPKELANGDGGIIPKKQAEKLKFERRDVVIGSVGDVYSEVFSGLEEGEYVVVRLVDDSAKEAIDNLNISNY